jgi:Kef-type K+ transport system membrane component KefB
VSFSVLALVGAVALLGPLLALPQRWRIPVIVGELAGGIAIGSSGFGLVNSTNSTFTFLADLGFGLTMFVAGSQVPLRDSRLRPVLLVGLVRALGVGLVAALFGAALGAVFHTGHGALYALLMASSSAALVVPAIEGEGLGGRKVLLTIAQVAIADTACIVALPLVIDPAQALGAAGGATLIAVAALAFYFLLRWLNRTGSLRRFHKLSEKRSFALELRVSLIVLFGLAAIAVGTHVSIMLAGFALGLAVSAVGEPKRLTRQLFALNAGFLGPLFFVWLGASLQLKALFSHPNLILLGVALGVGAILAHLVMRIFRQPAALGVLAAAQLGVPVAAATIGQKDHILSAGEPAALILGALITIVGLAIGAQFAGRTGLVATPPLDLQPKSPAGPPPAGPSPSSPAPSSPAS